MSLHTICGYDLGEVRKSLREAIGRRDRRAANRWAAELVVTPGAIGSLWASYWLACEASADGNPTLPILFGQTWTTLVSKAQSCATDWAHFRNDEGVRRSIAELTCRLLDYPRQSVPSLPGKEVALYDVSTVLEKVSPASADSPVVLGVWSRNHDSMELRQLAGHWIDAIQKGEMRIALSILVWSLLATTKVKCGPRGPGPSPQKIPATAKSSPMWYWFSLGASLLKSTNAHPGWLTFHDMTVEAMTDHYRRWSPTERLKILAFWTFNLRASLSSKESWSIQPVTLTTEEIDLPYKEIAAELAGKNSLNQQVTQTQTQKQTPKDEKASKESKLSQKMKDADDTILAMLGI